jgi:deoxyribodipyrimidine photolyase-related protein
MNFHPQARPRHLVLVLGDQLNQDSAAFDGFDPACDAVWMAEVAEESTHVWSHKARIAMFLSAMRHFRDSLRERGWTVHYRQLSEAANSGNFRGELTATTSRLCPQRLIWVEPGEWRVQRCLESTARALGVDFEVRPDRHFFCSREEFARHAAGRKQLRMEFFYRELRRKHRVLMDGDEPAGGAWNFDAENREAFGRKGPDALRPQPRPFEPDAVTREVLALVEDRFAKHPGTLDDFDWPVTKADAELALDDFITHRLSEFGRWQDAMWTNEPWLFHSRRGVMASKPYIASGKYIQRMSNYCAGCRYDPAQRAGPKACPFTTLYWDFLLRHETMLTKNPRTVLQVRNAARLTSAQRREITDHAVRLRAALAAAT